MKAITFSEEHILSVLSEVCDPEIPVLSIVDLGIVREIKNEFEKLVVYITPTYSGCPAMTVIELEMRSALLAAGIREFEIKTVLFPPWTTDWMSSAGLKKLQDYGIAPPIKSSPSKMALFGKDTEVACPQCGSKHTTLVSQFGSTACKSMYRCVDCKEPFDYFKCI